MIFFWNCCFGICCMSSQDIWKIKAKYKSCYLNSMHCVQEQDSHGGGFDVNQSFLGMMSDVHMWDHTLTPCEIQDYMKHPSFTSGNVLNWRALEFQTVGRVLIENKQMICYWAFKTKLSMSCKVKNRCEKNFFKWIEDCFLYFISQCCVLFLFIFQIIAKQLFFCLTTCFQHQLFNLWTHVHSVKRQS